MPSSDARFLRDRRFTHRHNIIVKLKHRFWKSRLPEQLAEALNISERGLFFVTDSIYVDGEPIELRFEMPEEVVSEPATEWLCTGHVVRTQEMPGRKLGVAIQFDCYDVARPSSRAKPYYYRASLTFRSFFD